MRLIENIIYELSRVNRKVTQVELNIAETTANFTQVNTLNQVENIVTRCISQLKDLKCVPMETFDDLKKDNEVLKQLINGEWVDCKAAQKALDIEFATGVKMFEFSRTAEWNPNPLNGQRAVTRFRLRGNNDGE